MDETLKRTLPFVIIIAATMLIYGKIDQKYLITDKISSKLKISKRWQPVFFAIMPLLVIIILGFIGILFIRIPDIVYCVVSGIVSGIGVQMATKIAAQRPKRS